MERIKIVELKIKHISKSVKGKRESEEFLLSDLDISRDEIRDEVAENVKTHFQEAFASGMEKLESYGNIIEVKLLVY